MIKQPLVSVIVSTYNNASTIKTCIVSIKKQSYKKVEIIIVDEWSTDKTDTIAKKLGVRLYSFGKERANNRNFGIKKSRGELLLILDSDMELTSSVIEECVAMNSKKIDAIVIPEKSVGFGYWAKVRAFERQFIHGDDSVEAARFFSKKIIKKIGVYDPGIVGAEDWDLHQRIINGKYKIARIKSFLYHHEGTLQLSRLLRKKIYYGKAFLEYKKRYPNAFRKSVLRISLLKNLHRFFLSPLYGGGVIILKFLEGMSLFYGMYLASQNKEYKHY